VMNIFKSNLLIEYHISPFKSNQFENLRFLQTSGIFFIF